MSLPTEMLREDILEGVAVYLVCFLLFFFFKLVRFVLFQTAVGSRRKREGVNRPVSVCWVTRAEKVSVGLAAEGLRCPSAVFQTYMRHLEITGGFGKGKTHELGVAEVHYGLCLGRLGAERC